jgi:hypothetical protein
MFSENAVENELEKVPIELDPPAIKGKVFE